MRDYQVEIGDIAYILSEGRQLGYGVVEDVDKCVFDNPRDWQVKIEGRSMWRPAWRVRVVKNVCRTRLHSTDKERLLKRSKELKGVE